MTQVEAIWVTAINEYTLGSAFKVGSEPLQSSARYPETREYFMVNRIERSA